MTKPLDQRRGSSRIRGYSRLSYGLTASTTIASARNEIPSRMLTSLDGQTPDWTDVDSYRYDSRSNSRAISLPPNYGKINIQLLCVCACVRACVRACVLRACVCVCVCGDSHRVR